MPKLPAELTAEDKSELYTELDDVFADLKKESERPLYERLVGKLAYFLIW
jgi:hypothetical protein